MEPTGRQRHRAHGITAADSVTDQRNRGGGGQMSVVSDTSRVSSDNRPVSDCR